MNIGVIFAGGTGSRMRSKEKPKQFLEIYNKPIIIYTLEHFEENEEMNMKVGNLFPNKLFILHSKKL